MTAPTLNAREVVLYTSIDDPYVRPLTRRFEQQTGMTVRLVTDAESTKSAALVERMLAEKEHPQADVYWGNEILHTLNLKAQGAFDEYRPATAKDVPDAWRDPKGLYTGIGLRVRMIAVSTRPQYRELVAKIHGIQDLADPALRGKIGISHPAFGTTSGHVAAIYLLWDQSRFTQYMQALRDNDIKLLGGNSAVADQVAAGTLIAGFTDNDDINNAKSEEQKLDGVLPDQGPDGLGTLLIPSTIALIHQAPHADAARKLIDFLCDPNIEKELVEKRFFAYSVRGNRDVKGMEVNYPEAARNMRQAVEAALNILQNRTSATKP